jgi:hypothetical protein
LNGGLIQDDPEPQSVEHPVDAQHPTDTSSDVHVTPAVGAAVVVVVGAGVPADVVVVVVVGAGVPADVVVVLAPGQFPGYPDAGTLYPRDGQ